MRAFISINLSASLQEEIAQLQNRLGKCFHGIRWIPAKNCHLTLKFLGDITEETYQSLLHALDPPALEHEPFTFQLGGLGKFPPRGPVSVLWVGIQNGAESLMALERSIHSTLIAAGVSFDKKKFVPHLTIGRARRDQRTYIDSLKSAGRVSFSPEPVTKYYLMESVLKPSGAEYTARARYPLGKTGG